jgi:hypothetical protein
MRILYLKEEEKNADDDGLLIREITFSVALRKLFRYQQSTSLNSFPSSHVFPIYFLTFVMILYFNQDETYAIHIVFNSGNVCVVIVEGNASSPSWRSGVPGSRRTLCAYGGWASACTLHRGCGIRNLRKPRNAWQSLFLHTASSLSFCTFICYRSGVCRCVCGALCRYAI